MLRTRLIVLACAIVCVFAPTRSPAQEVTERGSLAAAKSSVVIAPFCNVAVKWLIKDGSKVKKGDKLIELDDEVFVARLKRQREVAAKAEAEHKRFSEQLERVKAENQLDVKVAQIDVRLAQLAVAEYKGSDRLAKERLDLQLTRAGLQVERLKLKGAARESDAAAEVDAKKSVLDAAMKKQRAFEADVAKCTLTAPKDGVASLYATVGPAAAVGDPVSATQMLMTVSDLRQMVFETLIGEDVIAKVRKGQKASLSVDAFPKRIYTGVVQDVAERADHQAYLNGRKAYKVTIRVDGINDALLPGMSGAATIQAK